VSYSNFGSDTFAAPLVREAERDGIFTTGIASDKRQRGTAINVNCVGEDPLRGLVVVQVRECIFRPNKFNRVRKDYYLIGRIESGAVFAHAVDSPLSSKAGRAGGAACVDHVLSKIWGCSVRDLRYIIRQGDVALVPVAHIPAGALAVDGATIRESHRVEGPAYCGADGTIYVRRGARVTHTPGEHRPIKAREGAYRVVAGARAMTWGFSRPTID